MKFANKLMAMIARIIVFALIVFQIQRTNLNIICIAEVTKLSDIDPTYSKASPVKERCFDDRRKLALRGASLRANSDI